MKIGQIKTTSFGLCDVHRLQYGNGCTAITLDCAETGEAIAVLSVRLDSSPSLTKQQFHVKNWSENEEIAADALRSGLFTVVNAVGVRTGFIMSPIWAIKEKR